jgi:hypothetical protein
MTAAKPLPPHGTYARAQGNARSGRPRCTCDRCKAARRRYDKRRRIVGPLETGAARAADRIRLLAESGMTHIAIAEAANCAPSTIVRIAHGQVPAIHVTTAARILAIRFEPSGHQFTDATGTRRRIQAPMARGHAIAVILAASGGALNSTTVSDLLAGQPRVRVRIAQAARDTYRALGAVDPAPGKGSARSRNRALKSGWRTPGDWDGIDMDDPAVTPDAWDRTPRPMAVAEDAEFIARTTGVEDRVLIAARLGVTRDTLDANLARAMRFAAREPAAA